MRLACRFLTDVNSVNSYQYASACQFTQGDAMTVTIQLVDETADRSEQGFCPAGRRYVADTGATLQVIMTSLDDSKKITRTATAPYSGDQSIWQFQVLPTDKVVGTVGLVLILTEGLRVTRGTVKSALLIAPQLQG